MPVLPVADPVVAEIGDDVAPLAVLLPSAAIYVAGLTHHVGEAWVAAATGSSACR